MIRVQLPYHLRVLAQLAGEVQLEVPAPATAGGIIDALEASFPQLRGTLRDHGSSKRRPLIRFAVCGEDWSNAGLDAPLPDAVVRGDEPFLVIGALAGG